MKTPRTPNQEGGASLVLTLALIALVTFASVAFFSRSATNSAIENLRASQVTTSQIAESGVDHILSRFLGEVVTNSQVVRQNGTDFYFPSNPVAMVPARLVSAAILSNSAMNNLIRQSVSGADPVASTHSSGVASRDGRVVDANRWSTPKLLGATLSSTNQLPNWVYVNKDGTLTATPSTNAVGRFSYNAYDVGGLLDANVAGYPSSITASDLMMIKGTQAGADLTRISGVAQADVNALISFRNPQCTNGSGYADYVAGAAGRGFLDSVVTGVSGSVTTTNTLFASRQDLIRYAQAQNTGLTNALPYLTHFSREQAAPSITNNGLLTMSRRYDLSQLARLTNPAVATSNNLSGAFPGFTRSNTPSLSGTITNATPDLFSVLRAGISYTNSWETNGPTNLFSGSSWTTNLNLKAVALGADIIDRITTNSNPVRITYGDAAGTNTVAGKKQLPYISAVYIVFNKYVQTGGSGEYGDEDDDDHEEEGHRPGSNSITLYVSVIPQVWSAGASVGPSTLSASLRGGVITLSGVTNVALPTNTTVVVCPTNAGASAVYRDASQANPVSRGFFATNIVITKSISTSLSVTLTNLSIILKQGSNTNVSSTDPCYDAFGTNSLQPCISANAALASAALSGTVILTNLVNTNITAPKTNQIGGAVLPTADPRTLRYAGGVQSVPPSLPDIFTTTTAMVSIPVYPTSLSNTNWAFTSGRPAGVGDLGFVFRESPWRTIDFASGPWSADRNLLDLFSAFATPESGIRAGVVNLNTRQPVVLTALLTGASTSGGGTLSSSTASTYASNMVAITGAAPLSNRVQLTDLVYSNVIATAADISKESREASLRALTEEGQTRTWNMLLDVVAQNGKFTGSSTTPVDFTVLGERRVWVSVAIDRVTGRIVDRQTEEVNE